MPDGLTGVMTRSELIQAVDGGSPATREVGVVFMDVDGLVRLNYALGHQHIDALLVELAARIVRAVKGSGFVARWGGDEFVYAVFGDGDRGHLAAQLEVAAERAHAAVSGTRFRLPTAVKISDAWSGGVLNELLPIGRGAERAIRARHDLDRSREADVRPPALVTQVEFSVSIGLAVAFEFAEALDRAEQASVEARMQGRDRTPISPELS